MSRLEKKNVSAIIWIIGYGFSEHGCLKSLVHESEQQKRHLKNETVSGSGLGLKCQTSRQIWIITFRKATCI